MKFTFLHKENTGRLIIIFAGWSTGPEFYRHIHVDGWDILLAHSYTDFDFPSDILDAYPTVALFAWSLGVFMASVTVPVEKIALAVAVNGTENPVDDKLGIPANIFYGTLQSLSERNLLKFRRRMCASVYDSVSEKFNNASEGIEELRSQLEFVYRYGASASKDNMISGNTLRWHRVYISDKDAIFPPKSQESAWQSHTSHPEIIHIEGPHYVDLQRIISSAIPAKEKVGKRFHKALTTYDRQAIAQKAIAQRLTDFPGGVPFKPGKVLEIGPGTGIFTKLFFKRFTPDRIDYIDLYPLPAFNIAAEENYFTGDAEEWVEHQAGFNQDFNTGDNSSGYDAIISASALQWFANPEAFFRNASSILRPGGFILCSTFLPGNLIEMKKVNPYGLIYRSAEELEEIIGKYFIFAKLEEEELIIDFNSPLETLRHLKETGVGGGLDTGLSPRLLLESIPLRLSYRPLYIYAVKAFMTESDPAS